MSEIPTWAELRAHKQATGLTNIPIADLRVALRKSMVQKGGDWKANPTEDLVYGAEGNLHREKGKFSQGGADFHTKTTYETTADPRQVGEEAIGDRELGSAVHMTIPETGQESTSMKGLYPAGPLPTGPEEISGKARSGRIDEAAYKDKVTNKEQAVKDLYRANRNNYHLNAINGSAQRNMLDDLVELLSEKRTEHARDFMIGQLDRATQQRRMNLMEDVNGEPDSAGAAFERGIVRDQDKLRDQQSINDLLYELLQTLGHPDYQDYIGDDDDYDDDRDEYQDD